MKFEDLAFNVTSYKNDGLTVEPAERQQDATTEAELGLDNIQGELMSVAMAAVPSQTHSRQYERAACGVCHEMRTHGYIDDNDYCSLCAGWSRQFVKIDRCTNDGGSSPDDSHSFQPSKPNSTFKFIAAAAFPRCS